MGNEAYEETRKLVQSVRNTGSTFNMSLPTAKLRSEAQKLIEKCQRLITMLGGDEA